MKLTKAQKSLLLRETHEYEKGGEKFIILSSHADDKVAQNLSSKGLGYFTNHKSMYSWRKRDGYTNNFTLNYAGEKLRLELQRKPCSCVYETSRNSKAVRAGVVLSGGILKQCNNCKELQNG